MRIALQRLRQGGGTLTAFVLAIVGMGGPEDAINAVRASIDFLLRGTDYGAARWLTPEVLATPAQIVFVATAIAVLIWALWPAGKREPERALASTALPRSIGQPPRLTLECVPQLVAGAITHQGTAHVISIGPELSGYGLRLATSRAKHGSPTPVGGNGFIVVCKLTNYGDTPAFNVSMLAKVTLFDVEEDGSTLITKGARETREEKFCFPKVDPGPGASFTFFIENRSPYPFRVEFSSVVTLETFDEPEPTNAPLFGSRSTGGSGAWPAAVSSSTVQLPRPIAYEPAGISLHNGALIGVKFGVVNNAKTLMSVSLERAELRLDDAVVGLAIGSWPTILGSKQTAFWQVAPTGSEPQKASSLPYIAASVSGQFGAPAAPQVFSTGRAVVEIAYDDVPAQGIRRSRVTFEFPHGSGGYIAKIVEQNEF
jgi:hypothetical protein